MSNNTMSKTELLTHMQEGWITLNAFIKALNLEQMTVPSDSAGWTVKDHLMHLAVWEDGIYALLQGQSRHEHMGIDTTTWEAGDYDSINAIIQQLHKDKSLDEVLDALHEVHNRLIEKVGTLSDEDLQQPYHRYQPGKAVDRPVIGWIIGNTYEHYMEHIPWMEKIVQGT